MAERHALIAVVTVAGGLMAAAAPCAPAAAQELVCLDPEGRICKITQPLVAGALVGVDEQRNLGLVTVAGGCSGTLVNRSWILTADHCVTTDGEIGGPSAQWSTLTVTADWTSKTATPSSVVRNWGPTPARLDVALLYLGRGDLGPVNTHLIYNPTVEAGQTVAKYGAGIFQFATPAVPATATTPAIPAQQSVSDGDYRTSTFTVSEASASRITVTPNAGRIPNGGDSGGPDFIIAPNGANLGIAGVQSTCVPTARVPGMLPNDDWTWVTGISSCSAAAIAGIRFDLVNIITERAPAVAGDFDDDHRADILWYNSSTGEIQVWQMDIGSRIGRATVLGENGQPVFIGPPWAIVGSRDFDGNGRTDILWYNSQTGEIQIWFMQGARVASRGTVLGENGQAVYIGPPWSIVTTGDMNGDTYGDIVWHNAQTGETQLWLMNGNRLQGRATVIDEAGNFIPIGPPFGIVGTGDINADRRTDIIWHNAATGETQFWNMDVNRLTGRQTVLTEAGNAAALVGLPWRIAEASDMNHDGLVDLVWHNGTTGETQLWLMDLGRIRQRVTVDANRDGGGAYVGPPWAITRN